jgi:hypothetical protein
MNELKFKFIGLNSSNSELKPIDTYLIFTTNLLVITPLTLPYMYFKLHPWNPRLLESNAKTIKIML